MDWSNYIKNQKEAYDLAAKFWKEEKYAEGFQVCINYGTPHDYTKQFLEKLTAAEILAIIEKRNSVNPNNWQEMTIIHLAKKLII